MTDRVDVERQDSGCRSIDVKNVDGQYSGQQAASGWYEGCRNGSEEEEMHLAKEYENGHEMERVMPDGRDFLVEEDGIGVVEILLILVVLIALVIIFRERLTELLSTIFESINSKSATVMQ